MLRVLATRLQAALGWRVERVRRAVAETVRPSGVATGFGADLFRTRDELLAENAALRQQLIGASRKVKKPTFRPLERGLLVALASRIHPATHLGRAPTGRWSDVEDVPSQPHRMGVRFSAGSRFWFRPLFAFFVVDVNSKEVVHVAVTREPNETWTAQQLRQLTPFGEGPQFIIRDRDSKFGGEFERVAKGAGIRVLKTAVRTPLMNATCERFLGSVRRECLDHFIILGEHHLRSVLDEYVAYFNAARPHQGLQQHIPGASSAESRPDSGRVIALPVLGGLHHDYRRAA